MSEFEKGLRKARSQQRRLHLLTFVFFLIGGIVVTGFLVLGKGTNIKVLPEEAAVSAVLKLSKGYGLSMGNLIYTFPGQVSVTIDAEGFERKLIDLFDGQRGQVIEVVLREKPAHILAVTFPSSPETVWEVDDAFVGQGARLELSVSPGAHDLLVQSPFFNKKSYQLALGRGETYELEVNLSPVAGRLTIDSIPVGATVSIQGVIKGSTPMILELPGDAYDITVQKEGYEPIKETVEITHKISQVARSYKLESIPASIVFTVSPAGGELILNGKFILPDTRYPIDPNTDNSASYFADGYAPKTFLLNELVAREEVFVAIQLEEEWGELEVLTSPDTEIFIDQEKVGTGNLIVTLPTISHVVELRKTGYRAVTKVVTPTTKKSILIEAILEPELTVRLRENSAEYTNFAGLELKRFTPGSFTMGAPRHEPGQRANEFEKNINLVKIFYVGKYEVTNQQFKMFDPSLHNVSDNEPVVGITWLQAAAFCNWLSEGEGLTKFYEMEEERLISINSMSDGYRLLTEAEWEWIARKAGRERQSVFVWGNDGEVPKMAGNLADETSKGMTKFYIPNYNDGYAGISPVGSFQPDRAGLFDVLGNVREWVHDFYSLEVPEKGELLVDPLGPSYGDVHVVKGASWRSGTRAVLRGAYREGMGENSADVGFRVGRYLYVPDNSTLE